jgi:predicted RNA polymerase sigma factor
LITASLATAPLGPYQLQAAIAAVHDEAPSAEDTDWTEILGLYEPLEHRSTNPMVTLNHARRRRDGARTAGRSRHAGDVGHRRTVGGNHRLYAVRAHLQEMAGDVTAARDSYRLAARRTTSIPEQRYLESQASRLLERPSGDR